MNNCLNRLACVLMLESLGVPPEADEFVDEFCRDAGAPEGALPMLFPEAVVDGT